MKHIGTLGADNVAVLFRTVPGEPTNALVVKHDELPEPIKTSFKQCLESQTAQNAFSLSDAAGNFQVPSGEKLLNALHIGSFIEKVDTKDVILTPNANTTLPLNELNNIIDGAGGSKMVKTDPAVAPTINANPAIPGNPITESTNTVITDEQLATDLRRQAEGLQREASRLLEEAESLHPAPPKKRGRPAKTTA